MLECLQPGLEIGATDADLAVGWILCNDGAGEIADYIVLEVDPGPKVALSLWHAKATRDAAPTVRIKDMQEVTAQAIKSRRWATDRTLWSEVGCTTHRTLQTGPHDH